MKHLNMYANVLEITGLSGCDGLGTRHFPNTCIVFVWQPPSLNQVSCKGPHWKYVFLTFIGYPGIYHVSNVCVLI